MGKIQFNGGDRHWSFVMIYGLLRKVNRFGFIATNRLKHNP
ncbi:hypothetical protein [Coleofasciculus sp. F4-SAH-05]